MTLEQLVRPNIWSLAPYSCARNEFKGEAKAFLDANENPYGTLNRYPDPLQLEAKGLIAHLRGVKPENIMFGNGSDEPIDLVYRIFCRPGVDNVVAIEPTYGMYKVQADINDVEYRPVLLDAEFQIDVDKLLAATDANTKVIWLCSPNNPTGNLLRTSDIERVLREFGGMVIVDEAYIDFADADSWTKRLNEFERLIVLQTFSKAWGLAGCRCGMAYASEEIIGIFNKVKYPYNINKLTQEKVVEALHDANQTAECVRTLVAEREKMRTDLQTLGCVKHIYPSDANFLLVEVSDANGIYKSLANTGVVTRNRNSVKLCQGCIRITVGTPEENELLISEMKKL